MRFEDIPTDRLERLTDDISDRLGDRLDAATRELAELRDRAADALPTARREPSWSTRLGWLGIGAAIGALATWLMDPDRGRGRRQELTQRASATGRHVRDDVTGEFDRVTDRAEGVVREAARSLTPEDTPEDPTLLRQRIRSEVFGRRDDVGEVVIRVDAPGRVALKGTITGEDALNSLVREVEAVEGVQHVDTEVTVTG